MNDKLITTSQRLLSYFNEKNKEWFEIEETYNILHNSKSAVTELLSYMTNRSLLRLREGIYYIVPPGQDAMTFIPNWHLLAEPLVGKSRYYIGYYSALQIHNLITQPSLKEQIVVSKQLRPTEISIQNIPFQFIYHNKNHFFGGEKIWIDNFHQVTCSDLEKTIVDCLFKPSYAGGIAEIAKAMYISKDKIKFDKLLLYIEMFKSQAVIKRIGFLLELLEIKNEIIKELQLMKTVSHVVLDNSVPKQGKKISRWGIQQNVDSETIKSALNT